VKFFNDKKAKYNAIEVLPTGSGKSLILADIANRLNGKYDCLSTIERDS
jgi:DNA repair protein RadD